MATRVSIGDSQSVAVVGLARRRNRAQRWWQFVKEWPVLPVMLLSVLVVLALMADTPLYGGITGFDPNRPVLGPPVDCKAEEERDG